jgi:hypothetical protein
MSEQTQAPEASAEAAAPNLTVNDLAAVANVIDLAVQRGAFKAAEAKQVGEVFEKVASFVQHVADQQKEAEEAKADEQPAA